MERDVLLETRSLGMSFPVTSGLVFQRKVAEAVEQQEGDCQCNSAYRTKITLLPGQEG